jgi:hypothetical protein
MRLSAIAAFLAAGALLVGGLATRVQGGWFGLGGSDKPADASKSKTASASSQSRTATAGGTMTAQKPPASAKSTGSSLFGAGSTSTSGKSDPKKAGVKTDPKKANSKSDPKAKGGLYASRQKTPDKNAGSWWNPWSKPKPPASPKTTADWMKLKQVQY